MSGNPEVSKISKRLSRILRETRTRKGETLKRASKSSRIPIPISTLQHYETKGASIEAIRFLALLHYYDVTLGMIFKDLGFSERQFTELLQDEHFKRFCTHLSKATPARRSAIMKGIAALVFSPARS